MDVAATERAEAHVEMEQAQKLGVSLTSGVPPIEEPEELRGGQQTSENFASAFERAQRA